MIIAHRGNLTGPKPERENSPDYIMEALVEGFDVEIDVWFTGGKFLLGHDKAQYEIHPGFLKNDKLWCHAKTPKTFYKLLELGTVCFFHDTDHVTLTSNGYLWTYPGIELTPRSICVMPPDEHYRFDCSGICTDYAKKVRNDAGNKK